MQLMLHVRNEPRDGELLITREDFTFIRLIAPKNGAAVKRSPSIWWLTSNQMRHFPASLVRRRWLIDNPPPPYSHDVLL